MKRLGLAVAAALMTAVSGHAQDQPAADKRVSLPAEANLVVGNQKQQGRAVLVELVPAGETVDTFTRMVTLQTLPDMGKIPEKDFLSAFGQRYAQACPKTNVTEVPMGNEGVSGLRLDCPRHPATNTMETVFVRAMNLGRDLGVVQITMRYLPMPSDGTWARDYLGRVAVQ